MDLRGLWIDSMKPCVNGVDHGTSEVPHHPTGWCRECGPQHPVPPVVLDDGALQMAHQAFLDVAFGDTRTSYAETVEYAIKAYLWTLMNRKAEGSMYIYPSLQQMREANL